jgi:hypothetical protein
MELVPADITKLLMVLRTLAAGVTRILRTLVAGETKIVAILMATPHAAADTFLSDTLQRPWRPRLGIKIETMRLTSISSQSYVNGAYCFVRKLGYTLLG